MSAENPQEAVLQAMSEYAQAVRGDWSDFDGRTERNVIEGWISELREPNPDHDLEWHRRYLGLCMVGGGHWCGAWAGHCAMSECGCGCAS